MARPFKSGVDYFPLDVNPDDDVELLEAEHGIIGFGIWVKLYQKIYANNYWIKWNNKSIIVFSSKINVDRNLVNECINSCLEWGLFDKKLYDKFSILTSRGIQKRFFEIVKRRKCVEIILEYLLVDCPALEDMKIINVDNNGVNASKSTQRKGKERKLKLKNLFDQFWNEYPKKKSKVVAEKSFNRINPDQELFDKMIESLKIQRMSLDWTKDNGQFIPNPSTWLNQERWKDEINVNNGNSNPYPYL
jgi:hypothetical protein